MASFPYFNGTGRVYRRNNEARGPTLQCGSMENSLQHIRRYTDIFLQCSTPGVASRWPWVSGARGLSSPGVHNINSLNKQNFARLIVSCCAR